MNTEKENELNEQELWALIQDPVESEERQPKKKGTEGETESGSKAEITEKRKKALVWYLVGLFGIAFAIVLFSLFMRGQSGGGGSTTPIGEDSIQIQELYDRINELEEDNQALQEENRVLNATVMEQQEMMDGLNILIDELEESLEYVEESGLYNDENSEKLRRTMDAYETLVIAQNAFIDYDETVLNEAMTKLEPMLDLLSDEALNAYYMVTEYMEQPTLGQE